ncbi:MAG: NAD(P)/FAD-dependent oxidoreductase [Mucinivorans sp.]
MELNIPQADSPRIVVVGGGFAGVSFIHFVRHSACQIVLLDPNDFHQFHPLLYQVATAGLEPTAIAFPIRRMVRGFKNVLYRQAKVLRVDSGAKTVETDCGSLSYDYLVLACGTDTNYYGLSNIETRGYPLKSVGEAMALRNKILLNMELATKSPLSERSVCMSVAIVGGGATGVELAGALAELRNTIFVRDYPELSMEDMKIYLINSSDRLLQNFSVKSSAETLRELTKRGVEVVLGARVKDFTGSQVIYNDGQSVQCGTMVWVSGVVANVVQGVESTARAARVGVDECSRVVGADGLFCIGDMALMVGDKGFEGGHAQVAQVAIQQGRHLGRNLSRELRNKASWQPFSYYDKGSMATIGRSSAVAEIKGINIHGFVAWVAWLMLHLLYVVGAHNRLTVLTDWFWGLILYDSPFRSMIVAKTKQEETTILTKKE